MPSSHSVFSINCCRPERLQHQHDNFNAMSSERNRYPLIPTSCAPDLDFEGNITATYATEALLFSNTCIRALNNIYYYAPLVKPGDEADFAGYSLLTIGGINGHHEHGLGEVIFPVLQKKIDVTQYTKKHASYKDRVKVFEDYLKTVAGKGAYDGQKVRELLDSFGGELVQSLHEEVKSIDPENLKDFEEKELKDTFLSHRAMLQHLIETTPTPIHTMTHHDLKTAPSWPPQAKSIGPLEELKAYKETQGYWKFASYSIKFNGEEQIYA